MAVAVSKEKEFGEVYEVVRRPFVNSSDKSLKKTMVTLVNAKGLHHNIAFISYQFSEGEHPVDVKRHGNSKCNIPFFRTYQSTKTKLADQGTSAQPSRRFDRVFSDVGGLTQAEAAGQLPRNVRQANYETRKDLFKAKDPIFEITSAIHGYNESGDERFIRTYTLDDSSAKVVLFTDDQVDDIANFCCNDSEGYKSLLYCDVTFELGAFFWWLQAIKIQHFTSRTAKIPLQ
eukprot:Seg1285.5 transcript_id=Seg1285.5/GoldUCD/mRNA.D3Y31 product="hypothetical protein" protein_id=Seg1285.5/GoldUCD/D3Y31